MIYKHKQYVEIGDLVTLNNQTSNADDILYGQPCLVVGICVSKTHNIDCLDIMLPDGSIECWRLSVLTHFPLDDVYGNRELYVDKSLTPQINEIAGHLLSKKAKLAKQLLKKKELNFKQKNGR